MPSLLCCFGRRDSLSPQFHAGHQLDASVHPRLQATASDWASVPVDVLQVCARCGDVIHRRRRARAAIAPPPRGPPAPALPAAAPPAPTRLPPPSPLRTPLRPPRPTPR